VAALAPGILIYETEADGEVFVAVDEGVLVKTGAGRARFRAPRLGGTDLGNCATRWSRSF
jgi:F-type H+-transporting ATPase subunit epsilon